MISLTPTEREVLVKVIDALWSPASVESKIRLVIDLPGVGSGVCRDLSNRLREAFGMLTNWEGGIPADLPASSPRPGRAKGFAVVLEEDTCDEEDTEYMRGLMLRIKGVKEVTALEPNVNDLLIATRVKHELFEKVHRAFFPKESPKEKA